MRKQSSILAAVALLCGMMAAPGADPEKKAGLEAGQDLPGSFHPYNVNGKHEGQFHCVVCTHGLDPAVLVFVRGADFDKKVGDFLKTLDDSVAREPKARIGYFVVFLDLKNVVTDDEKRTALAAQLRARYNQAEAPFKQAVFTLDADSDDGLKGYHLDPDKELTVVLYSKLKIEAVFAFTKDKPPSEEEAKAIRIAVHEKLGSAKK
jgi:hypothetical protein